MDTKIEAIKKDFLFLVGLQQAKENKQPNGWDINLFKSSFYNKVNNLSTEDKTAIFDYMETVEDTFKAKGKLQKSVFTENHKIWKLKPQESYNPFIKKFLLETNNNDWQKTAELNNIEQVIESINVYHYTNSKNIVPIKFTNDAKEIYFLKDKKELLPDIKAIENNGKFELYELTVAAVNKMGSELRRTHNNDKPEIKNDLSKLTQSRDAVIGEQETRNGNTELTEKARRLMINKILSSHKNLSEDEKGNYDWIDGYDDVKVMEMYEEANSEINEAALKPINANRYKFQDTVIGNDGDKYYKGKVGKVRFISNDGSRINVEFDDGRETGDVAASDWDLYKMPQTQKPNLKNLVPTDQYKTIKSPKSNEFEDVIEQLEQIVPRIPKLYGTENQKAKDKIVYLHYFSPSSDWYVTELDTQNNEAFGYAILNKDTANAEWGYISIDELKEIGGINGVELDLYFSPVAFGELQLNWQRKEAESYQQQNIQPYEKIKDWVIDGGYFDINQFTEDDLRLFYKKTTFGFGKTIKLSDESVDRYNLLTKFRDIVLDKKIEYCQNYFGLGIEQLIENFRTILKYKQDIYFACKQLTGKIYNKTFVAKNNNQTTNPKPQTQNNNIPFDETEEYLNNVAEAATMQRPQSVYIYDSLSSFEDKSITAKLTSAQVAEYDENVQDNNHTGNVLLVAKATKNETLINAAKYVIVESEKLGYMDMELNKIRNKISDIIAIDRTQNEQQEIRNEPNEEQETKFQTLFQKSFGDYNYVVTFNDEESKIAINSFHKPTATSNFYPYSYQEFLDGNIDSELNNEILRKLEQQSSKFSLLLSKQKPYNETTQQSTRNPKPQTTETIPQALNSPLGARGKLQQHEINNQIRSLLNQKGTDHTKYSAEEIALLKLYEGSGGLAKQGERGARLLDQFFTPMDIIAKMWGLALQYGFSFPNSNILEPSVGSGRFISFVPPNSNANVVAYDVDETSYKLCKVLYPQHDIRFGSFEQMFFMGKRHIGLSGITQFYDLVITNPPYRDYVSEYSPLGEKDATGAFTFEMYFIGRGVDVLKPGGLLIMIVPNSFLSNNNKYNDFKEKLAKKADLIDAYRLPNGVFGNTDVGTDIIVLKKK